MTGAPERIGRYRVEQRLGEGGMGVVFAARDESLDRSVAIKMIHSANEDTASRERLRREARALASASHPNICQVFEIGEEAGELFIVMEKLDGEPLSARLARGALTIDEALPIGIGVLEALAALHARGLVHRDLKPSNVFLTAHGVKLLDFGLARNRGGSAEADPTLTAAGALVGTPRYLAPELWAGDVATAASDLFAAGALIYETIAGRPAFDGASLVEILHAITHTTPPALTGGPAVVRLDRILQRALAQRPEARPASARVIADELAEIRRAAAGEPPTAARAVTRLIVLPFRLLRPDPEVEFLAFSLPDAITASLSGLGSLVLRTSATAARYAGAAPDLRALAAEAQVDAALLGTLLRAGDQVRLAAQLVELPEGTVRWSGTVQSKLQDLFQLQDDLARHVVESLAIPLSARERGRLQHDVPATARAYEYYLRANEASRDRSSLVVASELYRSCVQEDPQFAPAWARLGRALRVIAKYGLGGTDSERGAGEAFQHALELSPDLPIAHHFYTPFEIENLGRAEAAMLRLLDRARGDAADPEVYTGLVMACRYCGLLEPSKAADERAQRLDPQAETSIAYTFLLTGEVDRAIARAPDDAFVPLYARLLRGEEEAVRERLQRALPSTPGVLRELYTAMLLSIDRKPGASGKFDAVMPRGFRDPEGLLYGAWLIVHSGETDKGLALLRDIGPGPFVCTRLFAHPWFDEVRGRPEFQAIVADWDRRRAAHVEAYRKAGGEAVLGPVE